MDTSTVAVQQKTLWFKTILSDSVIHDLYGTAKFFTAVLACVEETSGFAVWYRRDLKDDSADGGRTNGDYLLKFFSPQHRFDAIEFAVMMAQPIPSYKDTVAMLDALVEREAAMIR